MWHVSLKVPGSVIPVGGLAQRNDASFARAEMFDDPLDRAVLSACVTPLEYDQHLVPVLDDVPLNLGELNLEIAKRRLVVRAPIWHVMRVYVLRHEISH